MVYVWRNGWSEDETGAKQRADNTTQHASTYARMIFSRLARLSATTRHQACQCTANTRRQWRLNPTRSRSLSHRLPAAHRRQMLTAKLRRCVRWCLAAVSSSARLFSTIHVCSCSAARTLRFTFTVRYASAMAQARV